jgi:hypothetical protein
MARVSAMVYVALIVLISPFGWIAGQLSDLNRSLPFALNTTLFGIGRLGFLQIANQTTRQE